MRLLRSPSDNPPAPAKGAKPRAQSWGKLPWLRWSFDAWMSDPGLRMCSVTARGVWMDLLALAARSGEPGYLIHAGKIPSMADLTRMTGIRRSTLTTCIAELEQAEVFSRDDRGAIFSRRMVREAKAYQDDVEAGMKGGNPILLGSDRETKTERFRSENGAKTERKRTGCVPQTERNRPEETSPTNDLEANWVNQPVKADLDLDKDSDKKKGNPTGFPGDSGPPVDPKIVQLEAHRKAADAPLAGPRRRGVERVKPEGTADQLREEEIALRLWNQLAAVSNVVAGSMTTDRRAKLRLRLRDGGGIEGWQLAIKAVELSDLWQGRVGNGWRPTFDDILSRVKFRKLLEGGYVNSRPRGRADPNASLYAKHGIGRPPVDDGGLVIDQEDL